MERPSDSNIKGWQEYIIYLEKVGDLAARELPGIKTRDIDGYAGRDCSFCIKSRLNLSECCKAHPVTGATTAEGYCPHLNIKTGGCRIYHTSSYPVECSTYFCPQHISIQGE